MNNETEGYDDDPFLGLGYEAGIWVWRMDGLKPRQIPEAEHGTFRTGSCYIVAEVDAPSVLQVLSAHRSVKRHRGTSALKYIVGLGSELRLKPKQALHCKQTTWHAVSGAPYSVK